jgi:hypothetical protein
MATKRIAADLNIVQNRSPGFPWVPPRIGTTSIKGTTHKSWKIRIPIESRPWGESISALSESIFITMAVLLRLTRKPAKIDAFH